MITLRILLSPGRRGRVVDAAGRSVPQPLPAPVIGSSEPLRIILLDPATLDPADPYGFDTGAPLRLTISGDWDPATIPVYVTNDLVRTSAGIYDLADPGGTRTAEALALLGVLAERLCAWELTAYGGDPATEADWAHPLSVVQFDAPLRQRADSLGGDPAEAPSVDLRGPPGPPGKDAEPSDASPAMDGTASAGSSEKFSRGDHVHPSDTSRMPATATGDTILTGGESWDTAPIGTFADAITRDVNGRFPANLVAAEYDPTRTYEPGDYCTHASVLYVCTHETTGDYDDRYWNLAIVAEQFARAATAAKAVAIAPLFAPLANYSVGDYVIRNGALFRCIHATSGWDPADWTAVAVTDEMGGGGGSKPYDAEVEYIEAAYDQYIDTGIASNTIVSAYGMFMTPTAGQSLYFGARTSGASGMLNYGYIANYGFRMSYGTTGEILVATTQSTQWGICGFMGTTAFYNGTQISYQQSGSPSSLNAFLLCWNNNGSPIIQSGNVPVRLNSFIIETANGRVRDFIAVRKDGVGCLYDRVSGTFFYNAGTGSFAIGPDSSPYATIASPAFTGTPTAPTAAAGTNTTQIATTAFVQTAIAALRAELGLT